MDRVQSIAVQIAPISPLETGATAYERFLAEPDTLVLAVVDPEKRPIGLIERATFIMKMGATYGRALYAGRPVSLLMDDQPLTVDADVKFAEFTHRVLAERPSDLMRGFVVVRNGVYFGVGSALSLLQATNADNLRRAAEMSRHAEHLAAARAETQQASDQLREAVDAMTEGVAFFDAEDRYILWNTPYAASHRESAEALAPGARFIDVLRHGLANGQYIDAEGREEAWLEERLSRRRQPSTTVEQHLPDGRWLRVEDRRLPGGGLISVAVDITEIKQREASFRLLFDNNPVAMCLIDVETGDLLALNDAGAAQYGYDAEESRTLKLSDLVAPEERRTLSGFRPGSLDYTGPRTWIHVRKDGRRLTVLPYVRQTTYEDRQAVLVAAIDVTPQKEAEDALKEAQIFLDAIVEAVPEMLIVKDGRDQRIVLINRAGEELLGVKRAEVLGKTDHDLFPAEQADAFVERDHHVLASGELQVIPEEPIQTRDKGLRFLETKKIAMPRAEGEAPYLLAISHDITELKAASETLRAARDEAEAANRAKSEFLANMSHEIRTPLNGVLGVASVLADSCTDPAQREMVRIIEDSATTLERLLSDVLDVARVESGKLEVRREAFEAGHVVSRAAALFRPSAEAKSIAFTVDADRLPTGPVLGDSVRLQQVLNNLLSNAIKFTQHGGVTLEAFADGEGRQVFRVRDTGIGFDPERAANLFQRFEQADGSITRQYGGTGLGLAISRDLARLMGGSLSAESRLGEGATFTLILPLEPAEARPIVDLSDLEPQDADASAVRVLLADDHATNRRVVELILSAAGVDLVSVEDGAQAVEAFASGAFDLVLMDLQMPVMDGLTAIRRIRALERERAAPRTPVLALTANALPEHQAASHAAGADGHLTKPITAPTLLAAVSRALSATPDPEPARLAGAA